MIRWTCGRATARIEFLRNGVGVWQVRVAAKSGSSIAEPVQGRYTAETERQGAVHSTGMTEWIDVLIREETSIAGAWCTATDEEVPRVSEKLNELLN